MLNGAKTLDELGVIFSIGFAKLLAHFKEPL